MNVNDIMNPRAQVCLDDASLARAAAILWEYDCGIVPVVDARSRVLGVLTERDVCEAVATRREPAGGASVRELMSRDVPSCSPEASLREALRTMVSYRVRGLPVLASDGRILGMLSVSDVLLRADFGGDLTHEEVCLALAEIWKSQRLPEGAILCGWEHR